MKNYPLAAKLLAPLAIVILLGAAWAAWVARSPPKVSATHPAVPAEYQGIWQQVGYGRILSITDRGGAYYEHTRQTCILVQQVAKPNVAELFNDTEFSDDRTTLRMIPNEFELFNSQIIKLSALPAPCQPDNLIVTDTPTVTFEHLWHTFNDYYAFFAERHIDWQKLYTDVRPTVNDDMSADDLLDALSALLTPIDDGHITLLTSDDDIKFTKTRGAEKYIIETFPNQTEYKTSEEYIKALRSRWRKIRLSHFDSDIQGSAGGGSGTEVEWAATANNVGYLYIGSMEDLTSSESHSADESLEAINRIMKTALADLKNTNALIIDVRFNGGGLDAVSVAIANHFTDQPGVAYSKYGRNFAGKIDTAKAYFSPATDSPYLKPIVILATEGTASAAEVFLIIMSSLPHVTLMGDKTEGVLADYEYKYLPNQWQIAVPNVVFMDAKGNSYEATGVQPEIAAPTNLPEIFESQKDAAIDAALLQLGF